jgi:hypothetical protein
LQTDEILASARRLLTKLGDVQERLERFGEAHDRELCDVLRRARLKELDEILEDGRRRIAMTEDELRRWGRTEDRYDSTTSSVAEKEFTERVMVYVVHAQKNNQHAYAVGASRLQKKKIPRLIRYCVEQGDGMLLTPAEFEELGEMLRRQISASDSTEFLRISAGEVLYRAVTQAGKDLIEAEAKLKMEREAKEEAERRARAEAERKATESAPQFPGEVRTHGTLTPVEPEVVSLAQDQHKVKFIPRGKSTPMDLPGSAPPAEECKKAGDQVTKSKSRKVKT